MSGEGEGRAGGSILGVFMSSESARRIAFVEEGQFRLRCCHCGARGGYWFRYPARGQAGPIETSEEPPVLRWSAGFVVRQVRSWWRWRRYSVAMQKAGAWS